MPSSRGRHPRRCQQQGTGLIEVLVASALLGIALVVLLGSLSPLLVGSQVAERRTVEERLARSQIEQLMAQPPTCTGSRQQGPAIDGETYQIVTAIDCSTSGLAAYTVSVTDAGGGGVSLTDDRVVP
jgi:Tfp pilus assembly protein PilV